MGGDAGSEASGGGVEVEACGIGSTVTAKRMCSIALDSCCFGCGFLDTVLSVWNLESPLSWAFAPFIVSAVPWSMVSIFAAIMEF